jgi:hypothetical protein
MATIPPPPDRAEVIRHAQAIARLGLRGAVEVRTWSGHACPAGWEPRVMVLRAAPPPELVVAAVEETYRLEAREVRLAAYTPYPCFRRAAPQAA